MPAYACTNADSQALLTVTLKLGRGVSPGWKNIHDMVSRFYLYTDSIMMIATL